MNKSRRMFLIRTGVELRSMGWISFKNAEGKIRWRHPDMIGDLPLHEAIKLHRQSKAS